MGFDVDRIKSGEKERSCLTPNEPLLYIFNPNQAIFGGLSVLCWIYLFFYQPETANRSFEEIDEMFFKHVPARKFKHFVTDSERMETVHVEAKQE